MTTTTNSASVAAANELDRINTVLGMHDVAPKLGSEDGTDGWLPGDPLYDYPEHWDGEQYVRPMIQLHAEDHGHRMILSTCGCGCEEASVQPWSATCEPCEVSWRWSADDRECWVCGEVPKRGVTSSIRRSDSRALFADVDFSAVETRMLRQMNQRGSIARFLPAVADPAAPTVEEVEAAQPVPGLTWAEPRPEDVAQFRRLLDGGAVWHGSTTGRLTRSTEPSPLDDLMSASLAMTSEGFRRTYLSTPRRSGSSEFYSNRQRVLDMLGPCPVPTDELGPPRDARRFWLNEWTAPQEGDRIRVALDGQDCEFEAGPVTEPEPGVVHIAPREVPDARP